MARVEAAGGRVIYWNGYRVLGVLAMSRAIGIGEFRLSSEFHMISELDFVVRFVSVNEMFRCISALLCIWCR